MKDKNKFQDLKNIITVSGTLADRIAISTGLTIKEFDKRVKNKKQKTMIDLIANFACGQSCKQCYLPDEKVDIIDFEIFRKTARKLVEQNNLIYFYPTECTQRQESIPIYSSASMDRALTNGVNIGKNPELLDLLRESGIKELRISLLGKDAEGSKYFTRSDDFEYVKQGIRNAVDAGFKVSTFTIPVKSNLDELENIIDLSYSLGAERAILIKLMPFGRAKTELTDEFLDDADILQVLKTVDKLREKYNKEFRISMMSGFGPNFYNKSLFKALAFNNDMQSYCTAGECFMSAYYTGEKFDVYPCFFFVGEPSMKIGELIDGELKIDEEKSRKLRETLRGDCAPENCEYRRRDYCRGGCLANAVSGGRCVTKIIENEMEK